MALSALSLTITARYLGPTGRGVYGAANAWAGLFATFGGLSLGQVVIHHAAGRPLDEWAGETVATLRRIVIAVTAASWLLAGVAYFATRGRFFGDIEPATLALALLAVPFLVVAEMGRYVLNAAGALPAANRAQVIGTSLTVLVIFTTVAGLAWGVRGATLSTTVGSAAVAGATYAALDRRHRSGRATWPLARRFLRRSAQLHLNAIGTYLFTQASVLVLNFYRPAAETGYYQLAVQLFGMALILSTSVSTVAFGLVARQGPDAAWGEQRALVAQAVGAAAIAAAVAYVLAPDAIRLVAGAEFLPAVPLLRAMLPALIGATFSTVMASQWIGRGLFVQASVLTLVIGMLSIACDFALVPRLGARGAVLGTLLTYGISVLINGSVAVHLERRWRRSRLPARA